MRYDAFFKSLGFKGLTHQKFGRKIRTRKEKTIIGKYPFVNKTVKLWSQLPVEALATFPCKTYFRMKFEKVNYK